jgi:glycine hydroxymethyltransferase
MWIYRNAHFTQNFPKNAREKILSGEKSKDHRRSTSNSHERLFPMSYLQKYFEKIAEKERSSAAIAYIAALDVVADSYPLIAETIIQELKDQRKYLKLIASENYSSYAVQLAMGNWMTDKYSEGYVAHRFYAGCDNVDVIEAAAVDWAKRVFGADHAYVQPHSGVDANLVAFWAILSERVQSKELQKLSKKTVDELTAEEYEAVRQVLVNQKIVGMALGSGGHLTHGYRHNISSKMMRSVNYEVDPKTGLIDYSALALQVKQEKPLILIAGYSAYPRLIHFSKMREIAESVGAVLMVDMAHFSGLVAGKVMTGNYDPVPFAHIVTSTTHKTLRGPRGGLVLCTNEFKGIVDKGCPLVLGGPLPHVMAAKAVALKEASTLSFSEYAHQIVANAKALAEALLEKGVKVLTGGTDNHLILIDVDSSFQMNGRQAELLLREAYLTVNRNSIPRDPNGAWYTSGVRVGTAAMTTLGMGVVEMREIASIIYDLLKGAKPCINEQTGLVSSAKVQVEPPLLRAARGRVGALLQQFPLYPEIVIDDLYSTVEACPLSHGINCHH